MPHYGIILPFTRAISCHCQAQNDTSGEKIPTLFFTLHSSPNRLKSRSTLGLREVKSWLNSSPPFTHPSPGYFFIGLR